MKELNDIPKNNPFKVPEGYFEELPGKIISSTSDIEPDEEKKSIIRRLRPYLAVAATLAVLTVIGFTAFYLSSPNRKKPALMDITLNDFNINYINDIDLVTLEEKVADSGLFDKVYDINSNEIINYLISENIDILDIYEQL